MKQQAQLEKDQVRKKSTKYTAQRKLARHSISSTSTTQHDYGPQSQQPNLSSENLAALCQEYYDREVVVTNYQAEDIEMNTRGQAEVGLWFYHHQLKITASNFGRISKRRETTPVGSLVKLLLYSKHLETKGKDAWGGCKVGINQLPERSRSPQCWSHWLGSGTLDFDEPCLGCGPDALVNIPWSRVRLGIAEVKCPYTAQSQTRAEAAASNSKFSCSLSSSGELKLKDTPTHVLYYYQVQRTLAITKQSWCDFVIWTLRGTMWIA